MGQIIKWAMTMHQEISWIARMLAIDRMRTKGLALLAFWGVMLAAGWASIIPSRTLTSNPYGPIIVSDDPVNLATGEFFFQWNLRALGGPMPLDFQLFYGSGLEGKRYPDGFPWRFAGNHRITLERYEMTAIRELFIEPGLGQEIPFLPTQEGWEVSATEANVYQLQETEDYYYFLDPTRGWVYVLQKLIKAGEVRNAFLIQIQDRNGNALTFENPANLEQHGPVRISDGLGRELRFTYTPVGEPNPRMYLTAVADQSGRTLRFEYEDKPADNPDGMVLRAFIDAAGQRTVFHYDARGEEFITRITYPNGNVPATQTYDTNSPFRGIVQTQTDAFGNLTRFVAEHFEPYQDPESRFRQVNPDGSERVVAHTHMGHIAQNLVDERGHRIDFTPAPVRDVFSAVKNRKQGVSSYTYDAASGQIASYVNARGLKYNFEYAAQSQSFTNPVNGESVAFTFYPRTRDHYPDGTVEERTYDARGNVVSLRDRAGARTSFTYNSRGQVLTVTLPTGGLLTYTYDGQGNVKTVADSDTGTWTNHYDAAFRIVRLDQPDGTRLAFEYDANDRLLSSVNERGVRTEFAYDANGNLTRQIEAVGSPLARTNRFDYDALDRLIQVRDPAALETRYTYHYWGGLAGMTFADGQKIEVGFDPTRYYTRLQDEAGHVWRLERDAESYPTNAISPTGRTVQLVTDALGDVIRVIDARGQPVELERDAVQQIKRITDRLGRRMVFQRDGMGRLLSVELPVIGSTRYGRNGLGLIEQVTDPRGHDWKLEYTPAGRLRQVLDPLGRARVYELDVQGRLATLRHPDGVVETQPRDAVGNVTGRHFSDGLKLDYTYDEFNRLTSASGSSLVELAYDVRDNLVRSTSGGAVFEATWDARRRLRTAGYDQRLIVTYTYDARGLLSEVSDDRSGTWLRLSYDADRFLVKIERSNGVHTEFERNANGEIVRLRHGDKADLKYTRDAEGQVLQVQDNLPLDLAALLQDERLRLQYDAAQQLTPAGFAHDPRGRRTSDPERQYRWDSANRLTQITQGPVTITLEYTALGEVTRETVNGQVREYHHHYALPGHPVVAEKVEGEYRRFFIYTPSGSLLYSVAVPAWTASFYHFNREGHTILLTDAVGKVTDLYAYSPYGRLVHQQGTSDQPFTYTGIKGVRQMAQTGLYHMQARFYDSRTARFLTWDPVWLEQLEEPPELNPYAYARQNPLSYMDPGGLRPFFIDSLGRGYSREQLNRSNLPDLTYVGMVHDDGQIQWGMLIRNGNEVSVRKLSWQGLGVANLPFNVSAFFQRVLQRQNQGLPVPTNPARFKGTISGGPLFNMDDMFEQTSSSCSCCSSYVYLSVVPPGGAALEILRHWLLAVGALTLAWLLARGVLGRWPPSIGVPGANHSGARDKTGKS